MTLGHYLSPLIHYFTLFPGDFVETFFTVWLPVFVECNLAVLLAAWKEHPEQQPSAIVIHNFLAGWSIWLVAGRISFPFESVSAGDHKAEGRIWNFIGWYPPLLIHLIIFFLHHHTVRQSPTSRTSEAAVKSSLHSSSCLFLYLSLSVVIVQLLSFVLLECPPCLLLLPCGSIINN